MTVRRANCPACGGPVEFKTRSSLVTVCEFCQSVVARGDRTVEDWGKVSDLAYTGSPLQLGLTGRHEGRRFEIVGHVQYQHAAGGVWDEWYASFPNDQWGWLAEAQGKFYLTFEKAVSEKTPLPPAESLEPGTVLTFPEVGEMTVAEVGVAQAKGAEGEMPFALRPGERHQYADLAGPNRRFATVGYGDAAPSLYVGSQVTLDELGIPKDARTPDRPPVVVSGKQLNCPQCAGPLSLHAPDKTERIACPNCKSLLDVNQGDLKYLLTLKSKRVVPVIPLDSKGTIEGVEYTVIGMMERFVVYDGRKYPWTEYLLYEPRAGFRWLVHSDGHWSFVETLPAGEVREGIRAANYGGSSFALFQDARATVRHVVGEFYWQVNVGEAVHVRDFIAPPRMLSVEKTIVHGEGSAKEVNYSLGTYMPSAEVARIFGLDSLPKGWGIAPNQPSPINNWLYAYWMIFGAALMAIRILASFASTDADGGLFVIALVLVSVIPVGAILYGSSFEKSRWSESDFSPYDTE